MTREEKYPPVTVTFTGREARMLRRYAELTEHTPEHVAHNAIRFNGTILYCCAKHPNIEGFDGAPNGRQWLLDGEGTNDWKWCVFYKCVPHGGEDMADCHEYYLRRFDGEGEAREWAKVLDELNANERAYADYILIAILKEEW